MGILFVFLNAVAYFILTISYWNRHKKMDLFLCISSLYAFTAIMCFFNYVYGHETYPNLGMIAFLYLFVVVFIFLKPIRNFNIDKKTITIRDNGLLYILAVVFILAAAIDIITSLSHTSEIVESGMWNELRDMGYADEDSVVLYETPLQRFSKNVVSYLMPFALVYAFFQLTKKKVPILLTTGLFASIISTVFISAVADASRGMVVNLFVQLLICYLIFKNYIPKSRKKYIMVSASWVLYGFIAFIVAVSTSRFGDEVWDYTFSYLGHSMLNFNDGLFYSMHDYAWGKKFFDFFYDLFGLNGYYSSEALGSTAGHGFVTFVGSLFIDFGPYVTILVAILAVAIISRFFEKKNLLLSDIIMIVFYSSTMANGIFVSTKNRALIWVMTFVIYFITRKIENKNMYNYA